VSTEARDRLERLANMTHGYNVVHAAKADVLALIAEYDTLADQVENLQSVVRADTVYERDLRARAEAAEAKAEEKETERLTQQRLATAEMGRANALQAKVAAVEALGGCQVKVIGRCGRCIGCQIDAALGVSDA